MEKCKFCGSELNSEVDYQFEPYPIYDCPKCGHYIFYPASFLTLGDRMSETDYLMFEKYLECNQNPERATFIGNLKSFTAYKKRNPKTTAVLCDVNEMKKFFADDVNN